MAQACYGGAQVTVTFPQVWLPPCGGKTRAQPRNAARRLVHGVLSSRSEGVHMHVRETR